MEIRGRVLIVAGSDSGGGAGIQADIKAVTAMGGFSATAITALTAQNTRGVFGVHPVPTDFIQQQMRLVLDDIGADVIKLGMLHSAPVIQAVAEVLDEVPDVPVVLDPVMIAKGGHPLLEPEAMDALKTVLIPRARLITPNLPEAEALSGMTLPDRAAREVAARALLDLGAEAVLLKGGHAEDDVLVDLLAEPAGISAFEGARIATVDTHGTGCTLASAIAAGLAQGQDLKPAVQRAVSYVHQAIISAPGLGHGHGPLNHLATLTSSQGGA